MDKKYSEEEFKSFLEGMRKAADLVRAKSPDLYLISLNGGGPLFDILRIINRDVQESSAIYFPVSSKIMDCGEVITRCWENLFLEKKDETHNQRKILSIDEVVSGGSVERVLNGYNSASRRVARKTTDGSREEVEDGAGHLRYLFPLQIIGLREERQQLPTNRTYLTNVKEGTIIEIPVKRIITMDDPDFHIVNFAHPISSGWNGQGYYPTVDSFNIRESYLDLLRNIAMAVGVEPASIKIEGLERIREHSRKYSKRPDYRNTK